MDLQQNMASLSQDHPPILVALSARAFSSVGFGMSILSIWLGWLLPNRPQSPEQALSASTAVVANAKRARRRSAPTNIPKSPLQPNRHRRRISAPTGPTPSSIYVSRPDTINRSRRVYFIDSPIPPVQPKISLPPTPESPNPIIIKPLLSPLLPPSPQLSIASSSTLISLTSQTPTPPPFVRTDTATDSIPESDSSSRQSSLPSLVKRFKSKSRRSSLPSSQASEEPVVKPVQRANTFSPPWCISRSRATIDTTPINTSVVPPPLERSSSLSSGGTTATTSSSTSRLYFTRRVPSTKTAPSVIDNSSSACGGVGYFTRKPHRRTSAPVPRTQPYDAPYFAQPPVGAEEFVWRQQKSRFSGSVIREEWSEEERGRERRSEEAEAGELGMMRPVVKRRSASWSGRGSKM